MMIENKLELCQKGEGGEGRKGAESSTIMLDSISMKLCIPTCMLTVLPKHAYMVSL